MNVNAIMAVVAEKRPIFHSEADFQHAFAWELHRAHPQIAVRLEVPVRASTQTIHLDLLARSGPVEVAVELKYKTRKLRFEIHGERYSLANQAAQDQGRYDFFKDLYRVEEFTNSAKGSEGYAIFLTNDSAYWKAATSTGVGYADFAINGGRNVSGELKWGERASDGTRRGRDKPIKIGGTYLFKWHNYSQLLTTGYSNFRYLCVRAESR